MKSYQYTDPKYRFSSTVEIGKYLVTVEIDDLPKASFCYFNLKDFIHSNPEAIAVLLEFHKHEPWHVCLSDEQTISMIRDVMKIRGYHSLSEIVENHLERFKSACSLRDYWRITLIPELMHHVRDHGIAEDESLQVMLAWCNPAVASQRLHPRAIQFIGSHWPKIVDMHKANLTGFEKLA